MSQPPSPRTDTCKPELPTRRYNIPVFLGSAHAIVNYISRIICLIDFVGCNTGNEVYIC